MDFGMPGSARHSTRTRRRIVLVATILLVLGVIGTAQAEVITSFSPRFSVNAHGSIEIFGNNILTCPQTAPGCLAARTGVGGAAALNNNGYQMVEVDIDADPTTSNSSSATVVLPAGSAVMFAGLYWGAYQTAGSGGTGAVHAIDQILLRAPGDVGYSNVAGTVVGVDLTAATRPYHSFADVTSQVQNAGPGVYTVANVGAATGNDRYGGWSLVVVYTDPTAPARNLTVFDGFADVRQGESVTIPISGLLTPSTAPVNASIGVITYEGERGASGDSISLNGVALTDALTPANNFNNSFISHLGVVRDGRSPNDNNTFGYDAKTVDALGIVPPSATSADLTLATNLDIYFPGVVTTVIDLEAPDFPDDTKSVTGMSQGAFADVGDTLTYTVSLENIGGDVATASVLTDAIPADTTYVPGSLTIDGAPMTDAAGDDQAELDEANLVFRVGGGADAVAGGTIGVGETVTVTFDVLVVNGGVIVSNQADLAYTAGTSGFDLVYQSNEILTPVIPLADLVVAKTQSADQLGRGDTLTYTVTIDNLGPSDATGVIVTDPIPPGLSFSSATPSVGTYDDGTGVWTVGALADGAGATLTIETTVDPDTSGLVSNLASVQSDLQDPDLSNNSVSTSATVILAADLGLTKSVTPDTAQPGQQVTYTLEVTNNGGDEATAILVTDVLPAGISFVSATPSAGSYDPDTGSWAIPIIGPTETEQLELTATVDDIGVIVNNAAVSANEIDPNPNNDLASASLTVQQVITTTTTTSTTTTSTTTTSTTTTSIPTTSTTIAATTVSTGPGGGSLADTGSDIARWATVALVLILGGALLVVTTRKASNLD